MAIRIDLNVEFEGAFNVGAGSMGGSVSRRPLTVDWRGLPMVPGSSFKGRLRHICKRLAEGLGQATCGAPYPDATCPNGTGSLAGAFCPVCRIFGASQWPSPLTFSDLILVEPAFLCNGPPPPTSLRYGVGISRRERVAADQLLYDTEVFMPGAVVTLGGEIEGSFAADEGPSEDPAKPRLTWADLGLLVAGLENLRTLGGSKTGGLGWCDPQFTVYQKANTPEPVELPAIEIKRRWLRGT